MSRLFLLTAALGAAVCVQAAELPECRELWRGLIPGNQHKYDYQTDVQPTELGNQGYDWAARLNRKACKKKWTVLVFISAENDLHPYAMADLYEMEAGFESETRGASTIKTDLIVELDSHDDEGYRRLHIFQTPEPYDRSISREDLLRLQARDIRSPIVEIVPEEEPVHVRSRLRNFLRWAVQNYPSEHYMLILWGHGQGWTSVAPEIREQPNWFQIEPLSLSESRSIPEGKALRDFGGLAFSENEEDYLDIPSLREVLEESVEEDLSGRPFDLYVSDACLMQMVEVAYELTDVSRFVVGSPQIQNYFGLPYRSLMLALNRGDLSLPPAVAASQSSDEAWALAYSLPEIFKSSFSNRGFQGLQALLDPEGYKSLSMSSLSSSEVRHFLAAEVHRLGLALLRYLQEDPFRQAELRYLAQNTPEFAPGMRDMGIYLWLMKQMLHQESLFKGGLTYSAQLVQDRIYRLESVLQRGVVNRVMGESVIEERAQAIFKATSLWIPGSLKEWELRRQDFANSRFYSDFGSEAGWPRFLTQLWSQPPL